MNGNDAVSQLPSFRDEARGWLGFLLFVAGVYWLRRTLNQSADAR